MTWTTDFQELVVLHEGDDIIWWRGVRCRDRRPVILKRPGNHEQMRTRFALKNELAILRELAIPGILNAIGLEEDGHGVQLLLDDFDGLPLIEAKHLADNPIAFLDMARNLVTIIGLVHQHHIIHKNIRPESVLINDQGEVRLSGFHYARRRYDEPRRASEDDLPVGTLAYISPEQTGRMNRQLDLRSDFYSLGVTFYEVLTGRPAFEADDPLEMIYNHIARRPEPMQLLNSSVPNALAIIISKMMAKTPEERYQGAYGLLKDLTFVYDQLTSDAEETTFVPGRGDVSGRFMLPERIYGREREFDMLRDAYARVQAEESRLVLVSGPAGYGKTSLILEMVPEFVSDRAYFARGHFEQYQQNEPFTGLIRALRDLLKQILSEPDGVIAAWRRRLLDTLRGSAASLVALAPELELIIGSGEIHNLHQDEPDSDTLRLLLPHIFGCFGTEERPLVLFLDDLHWSDEASRTLLDRLTEEKAAHHTMIIGAWRQQDSDEAPNLFPFLEQLRERGARVEHITLDPLERNGVVSMISDAFNRDRTAAGELAEVAMERTGGNPYFFREFLKRLYRDHMIIFDFTSGQWTWDLDRIRQTDLSGNLADLLLASIQSLPPTTQYVLQYAGCVGNPFLLEDLAVACEMNPDACADCLARAVQEGLVFKVEDKNSRRSPQRIRYAFQHDRLLQAAASMMAPNLRQEAHLRLGRHRLKTWSDHELAAHVFEVVNHFNRAIPLMTDAEERERLSRLNLEAGRRAVASRAYDAAGRYLDQGFSLLAGDYWRTQRQLALNLYLECAHSALARNRFNRARDLFESLMREGFQETEVYRLGIMVYTSLGDKKRALALGREGLNALGISIPQRISKPKLWKELIVLMGQMRSPNEQPPDEMNPLYQRQARLLLALSPSAFGFGSDFWAWVVLKASTISLRSGQKAYVALAYALFAVLLGFEWNRWERGIPFAKKGFQLSRRISDPHIRGRVLLCYAQFYPLMDHLPRAGDYYAEAIRENNEAGLVFQAAYSIMGALALGLMDGRPLSKLHALHTQHANGARLGRDSSEFFDLVTDYLAYLEDNAVDGNLFAAVDPDLKTYFLDQSTLARFLFMRMSLDFLAGNHKRVLSDAAHLRTLPGIITLYHPFYHNYLLFEGLALATQATGTKRIPARFRTVISRMRRLARMAPANFQASLDLLSAEDARLRDRYDRALKLYDQAVRGYAEFGFLHLEALSRERIGRFFFERGMEDPGRSFLLDARDAWARWGATRHLRTLDAAFPTLVERKKDPGAAPAQVNLDLATLVKASQTISREIDLSKLLENIMMFLLENAGAQRGVLLLQSDDGIRVEAEGDLGRREVRVRLNQPLEESERVCHAVVKYVIRTRESLVLEDASRIGRFMRQPYFHRNNKRSVLCLPIFHQGALTGLVYLENDLITGAFTPERLALLSVLSGQFAISLENARLYEQLDAMNRNLANDVEERTLELQKANMDLTLTNQNLVRTQEKLIDQEKMANLGAMASGIAHEIKNPLNFIDNFAGISLEITRDLLGYLKSCRKVLPAKDQAEVEELLKNLRENSRFITLHGARINEIVDSMISFSVRSTNQKEFYPLNDLLFEFADIAYRGRMAAAVGLQLDFRQELDPTVGKIHVVREDLGRALVNLLNNAFEAADRGHTDTTAQRPMVHLASNNLEGGVEIIIRDNGSGIPEDNRDKVFAPFYTTKHNGTGLGLAIAQDIIRNTHGGTLTLNFPKEGGTECVIFLPK